MERGGPGAGAEWPPASRWPSQARHHGVEDGPANRLARLPERPRISGVGGPEGLVDQILQAGGFKEDSVAIDADGEEGRDLVGLRAYDLGETGGLRSHHLRANRIGLVRPNDDGSVLDGARLEDVPLQLAVDGLVARQQTLVAPPAHGDQLLHHGGYRGRERLTGGDHGPHGQAPAVALPLGQGRQRIQEGIVCRPDGAEMRKPL